MIKFRNFAIKPHSWDSELSSIISNRDVSAVVCTKNSMPGISDCLSSLREAGIGEIIVVDAHSTDGTVEVARNFADQLLSDSGTGLGNARNIGISHSTKNYILNLGSDNIVPPYQLERMTGFMLAGNYQGVGAQTIVEGWFYLTWSQCLAPSSLHPGSEICHWNSFALRW